MGLIAEPNGVDFYIIDKPWTEQEKLEFSELINKEKSQKKHRRTYKIKKEKHTAQQG